MENKMIIAMGLPIVLFVFKMQLGAYIYYPVLIVGFIVSLYFYQKNKSEDLKKVLGLYGFNFFFIFIGLLIMYLVMP